MHITQVADWRGEIGSVMFFRTVEQGCPTRAVSILSIARDQPRHPLNRTQTKTDRGAWSARDPVARARAKKNTRGTPY